MLVCPVDLEMCPRAACRGGHCERAGERLVAHCWECGFVTVGRTTLGICAECSVGSARTLPDSVPRDRGHPG